MFISSFAYSQQTGTLLSPKAINGYTTNGKVLITATDGSITGVPTWTVPNLTVNGGTLTGTPINGTLTIPTSSTTVLTGSTNITVSGTTPNYTISSTTPTLTVVNGTLSGSYPTQTLTIPTTSTTIVAGSNITTTLSGTTYTIAASSSSIISTNSFVTVSGSSLTAKPNYVTPEMYGAVGDGSTDDATALQNAINTGSLVLLGNKNYRISSPLTFTNNVRITGSGNSSTISSITNSVLINITGSNNNIDNITLSGNAAGANQIGVQMLGVASLSVGILNNIISNSRFQGLYTGVSTTSVVGSTSGAKHEGALTLNSNIFNSCTYGLVLGARAEYNIISSNKFESCTNGVSVLGGNNNFNENYIVDCTNGIVFTASSNDTNSSFNGGKITHCTTGITGTHSLDFAFNGSQIFASNISLTSAGETSFNNCEIGLSTNTLSINTSTVYFNNCNFSETVGSYTVTGNKPFLVNCYRGANQMITPAVNTSASFVLNNGAIAKRICNFYDNDALVLAVADGGHLTFSDGVNVVLSSSTGTKFGTATTQKLAFYNSTPKVQPTATTELGTALSNLGLRASGSAYPITTSGAVSLTGGQKRGYLAKTASYTITTSDYLIDCTANTFTVTLPTAVSESGQIYEVVNSGAGTITLATTSSQTFANVSGTPTTLTIAASLGKSVKVMSNGANWIQLN